MATSSGHLGEQRFPLEERRIALDSGVTLSVKSRGEGPPVVLLHGFPQNSHTWRKHLPMLANAGFRAIAPDMRGYGASDKPKSVSDYAPPRLVDDVSALVRSLGYEKVHLVGHDWGAVVAFYVAALRPDVVDRLVILNGPHPDAYTRALLKSQAQRKRSWYVFAFQLPFLPERVLALKGTLPRLFRLSGPGVFSDDEIDTYTHAIRQPGAARAMVNYYRASARYRGRLPIIKRPTLVLWGEKDVALGTGLLDGLDRYVESFDVQRFPDASHWLPEEKPDEVHSAIVRFLRPS
ncbi:alpha/beta fold hydrolase [Pendulispora albinea]|uniref:Alpha/beta fold hydrolase n=1 Tax=Pendulispora albinea TaxID=2741071 RepID=A0ABZ2LQN6_9BACT